MNERTRIFIAGGETLFGKALRDLVQEKGFTNLVGVGPDEPSLIDTADVVNFFAESRPEVVFLVGGLSGGIGLNRQRPAELMLDNLKITINVLEAAHEHGVDRLLYLASSCAYPKNAEQPMAPSSLMTGRLEATSEPYAMAKLAGWKLCEAYRGQYGDRFTTAFPANAFGPDDDFDPESGHVIPALIRRAHEARERDLAKLVIWGSGSPRREFIYSSDLADACLFTVQNFDEAGPINLGCGEETSIAKVARIIVDVVGYRGKLEFDSSQPDGALRKSLDSSRLRELGWRPTVSLREGIERTYRGFLQVEARMAEASSIGQHRNREERKHAFGCL